MQNLAKPYPADFSFLANVRVAAVYGLLIGMLLFLLKPFGLGREANFLYHCLAYGSITFLCLFFIRSSFPLFASRWSKEQNWSIGKELVLAVLVLLLIGLANAIYTIFAFEGGTEIWSQLLMRIMVSTVALGLLPIALVKLYVQNKLLSRHVQQAALVDTQLTPQSVAEINTVRVVAANEKAVFEHTADEVLVFVAEGNYVEVLFLQEQQLTKQLIRQRLTEVEKQLSSPSFFRCHRSYIVNLQQVQQVGGNARGYELRLGPEVPVVPVSRSKLAAFEVQLQQLRQSPEVSG